MKTLFKLLACLLFLMTGLASASVSLLPQSDGIHVASDAAHLLIGYPVLVNAQKTKYLKPIQVTITDARTISLDYDGGVHIQLTVTDTAELTVICTNPGESKYVEFRSDLAIDLKSGGSWQFGSDAAQAFPAEYAGKPHLYQGNASPFRFWTAEGKGLSIQPPASSYQELNDLREWKTESFHWMSMPALEGSPTLTYHFDDAGPAPTIAPSPAPSPAPAPAPAK